MSIIKNFSIYLIICLLCCGCSIINKRVKKVDDPATIFAKANIKLEKGKWQEAEKLYENLEMEFPASEYASTSLLRRAYTYYAREKYTEAIESLDKFIQENPTDKAVAYAYYLKALSYYGQVGDVSRDNKYAILSLEVFDQLINRFPNSKYSQDIKIKKDFVINILAGTEMEIGRFYLKSSKLIAALNRFKRVIEIYQNSIFIEEALYRSCETLMMLGLTEEAKKYAILLGYNYPQGKWYNKAQKLQIQ